MKYRIHFSNIHDENLRYNVTLEAESYVQITHEFLCVGPNGSEIAVLDQGDWILWTDKDKPDAERHTYTDVVVEAVA